MLRAWQHEPKGLIVLEKYSRDKSVKSALIERLREAVRGGVRELDLYKDSKGQRKGYRMGHQGCMLSASFCWGVGGTAHGGGGRVTGFLPLGVWTDTSQPLPTLDLSDISSKFRRVNSILEPVFSTIQ